MDVVISSDIVLYNDMKTNHFTRSPGDITKVAAQPKNETPTMIFDPYTQVIFYVNRSGLLCDGGRVVTIDAYRKHWAASEKKRIENCLAVPVLMAGNERLGRDSLLRLLDYELLCRIARMVMV
jgi:hypothetical protein